MFVTTIHMFISLCQRWNNTRFLVFSDELEVHIFWRSPTLWLEGAQAWVTCERQESWQNIARSSISTLKQHSWGGLKLISTAYVSKPSLGQVALEVADEQRARVLDGDRHGHPQALLCRANVWVAETCMFMGRLCMCHRDVYVYGSPIHNMYGSPTYV